MTTRPGEMSSQEADKIANAITRKGGSITVQDPRVSQFVQWASVLVGSLLTIAIAWGVKSINELSANVAVLIEQQKHSDLQYDRLERRLERIEAKR